MTSSKEASNDRAIRETAILDAAEELLLEVGYGSVSTRKVAKRAGLTAPLLHYYFKTTDDLLLAVYRRAASQSHALQADALAEGGLSALWESISDRKRMQLAVEFMAMANHRPAIRAEIARTVEDIRKIQQAAIERAFGKGSDSGLPFSSLALTVIGAGIGQALVMEEGVGITLGHDITRKEMSALIAKLLASRPDDGGMQAE